MTEELLGGQVVSGVLFALSLIAALLSVGSAYAIPILLLMLGSVLWGVVMGVMIERNRNDESP